MESSALGKYIYISYLFHSMGVQLCLRYSDQPLFAHGFVLSSVDAEELLQSYAYVHGGTGCWYSCWQQFIIPYTKCKFF